MISSFTSTTSKHSRISSHHSHQHVNQRSISFRAWKESRPRDRAGLPPSLLAAASGGGAGGAGAAGDTSNSSNNSSSNSNSGPQDPAEEIMSPADILRQIAEVGRRELGIEREMEIEPEPEPELELGDTSSSSSSSSREE